MHEQKNHHMLSAKLESVAHMPARSLQTSCKTFTSSLKNTWMKKS